MKELFTTFFLPYGLVLLGLAALSWFGWRKRFRGGVHFGWMVGLFVAAWLLACPAVGRSLSMLLFSAVEGPPITGESEKPDVMIVLTAGIFDGGPGVGWMPKPQSLLRMSVAYDLQRLIDLRMPVVVSGGFTEGGRAPSEARVVADFFARHRSEVTPTELEEISTDTYESALQLAPVLKKRGYHHVLLVTSDVHMLRALAVYRARGVDAVPVPVVSVPHASLVDGWLPSVHGLLITTDALYEVYGLLSYLLTGKIHFSDL